MLFSARRTSQPQTYVGLNPAHILTPYLANAGNFLTLNPQNLATGKVGYWTLTSSPGMDFGAGGRGLRGNGSSSYVESTVSLAATTPRILLTIFTCRTVSTAAKTAYMLGSNAASGAQTTIVNGNGTVNNISSQVRYLDAGTNANSVGPTPVAGQVYACALYVQGFTDNTQNTLYVNGVKYSGASATLDGSGSTLVHEAAGANKRNTAAAFSDDVIHFVGRTADLALFPQADIWDAALLEWTANPWALFQPTRQNHYVNAATAAFMPPYWIVGRQAVNRAGTY